ncbi:SAM-dependent methyltransferase [Nitrococcus mobilis]|uniref:Cyclopropane-fatty-acyl-phospholipid synthase n=1 Tax=Nitrococcus mobilis Nb-231 TaxID=314278 RepID=A4BSF6_9GAMM|nr:cyclopropane-fatty-acyl-phospholipid synthase family protein [Nitrococcus mobilis]EAR21416.1 cyclopropane-fatty-acyl-phospholipid synthase [Nitrococcus mobilis Nb-231]
MVLDSMLEDRIRMGSLVVDLPDGSIRHYGNSSPQAHWCIHDASALNKVAADPEFMLGQTYMDGAWSSPSLITLLEVLMRNFPREPINWFRRAMIKLVKPIQQWNRIAASQRNAAHHYDLDVSLFRRFLDEDMQYSCAYWSGSGMTLEQAQRAKKEHIRRKLLLAPGQRVIDIGCGWGGLAIFLAETCDVRVTGLTLSREQYRVARERVKQRGLEALVEIRLEDYRENTETYDRVVSVGMFEHVGAWNYNAYFRAVRERLTEDGVALIHTIGSIGPPGLTNPWIRHYIFPGGYIPAMSEVMAAVERQYLVSTDVEVLRLHYAFTLAQWQQRFQRVRAEVAAEKSERFCRMWEFYLALSEAAFRWRDLVVFQFQLARNNQAVPLTRFYLHRTPDDEVERSRALHERTATERRA